MELTKQHLVEMWGEINNVISASHLFDAIKDYCNNTNVGKWKHLFKDQQELRRVTSTYITTGGNIAGPANHYQQYDLYVEDKISVITDPSSKEFDLVVGYMAKLYEFSYPDENLRTALGKKGLKHFTRMCQKSKIWTRPLSSNYANDTEHENRKSKQSLMRQAIMYLKAAKSDSNSNQMNRIIELINAEMESV